MQQILDNIKEYIQTAADVVIALKNFFIDGTDFLISPFKETLIFFIGIFFVIITIKTIKYVI